MSISDLYYRVSSLLVHRFTANNTLGYGIHSPSLFYIVRFLVYDNNPFYCFSDIEKCRSRMLLDGSRIYVEDFGTGNSGERQVGRIASDSLMPREYSQLLFRLVNNVHPKVCVELGTNLGITTAYIAKAAGGESQVFTFEGSKSLISRAGENWKSLGCKNINVIEGNIDATLEPFLETVDTVDFALIDAHHTYDATVRYFESLASKCTGKSFIVLDDIHYSREMGRAWAEIKKHAKTTATLDLYDVGIVFFDKQLQKKHYKLRYR